MIFNEMEHKQLPTNWSDSTQAQWELLIADYKKKNGKDPVFIPVRNRFAQYHLNVFCGMATHFFERIGKKPHEVKVLEIGSYFGESSRIFAGHFGEVTCVDPYGLYKKEDETKADDVNFSTNTDRIDAYVKDNDVNDLVYFYFKHNALDNSNKIKHFRLTSDEYFEQFDEKFDLIYVDGDHRYSQQIKDYTNALQVLNRDGILGGHDFNWQSTQKVIVDMGWAESPISIFMDNSFMLLPL
jgi:hypothetical protein